MKNLPALKVYKIDYDFIVQNYLDVKLWQKTWTLLEYRNFIFKLNLSNIDIEKMKICYRVKLTYKDNEICWLDSYSLKINDTSFMRRQIETIMIRISKSMESNFLRKTDEYKELSSLREEEYQKLTDIAEEFIKTAGVTNKDLIDAYVDAYVSSYNEMDYKIDRYLSLSEYTLFPELFLMLANITDNVEVADNVKVHMDSDKVSDVLKDYEEYKEYMETEDWKSDAENSLEKV